MKVEVDLEDLETIIFATAVIKTIETQLAARRVDPFIKPHLAYSNAHDNLVSAMNSARRGSEQLQTLWNGELTEDELSFLTELDKIIVLEVDGEHRRKSEWIDSLASKGCLMIGQCVAGAVWPGADKADLKPVAMFAIKITRRGHDKLEKLKLAQPEKLTHATKS